MSSVTPAAGPIHLGMDTSKNTIVVGTTKTCRNVNAERSRLMFKQRGR